MVPRGTGMQSISYTGSKTKHEIRRRKDTSAAKLKGPSYPRFASSLALTAAAFLLLAAPTSLFAQSNSSLGHPSRWFDQGHNNSSKHKPRPTTAPAPGGDPMWNASPSSGDWNTAANWTPATVPNGSSAIAAFGTSSIMNLSISTNIEVNNIVFNAGASAFNISVGSPSNNNLSITLTISGTGITNNSGINQNFA